MKRTIAILLSFIMVLCSIPFVANAADSDLQQIEINEENFPDPEFRKYISETYDTDQDGFITKEDKRSEYGIDIQNMDVKSLEGYELLFVVDIAEPFIYLKNTQVTEFKATDPLKRVAIYSTPLEKIDLSDCEHLYELTLENTNISELDVTNNIELTYLDFFCNHVRYIDLSKNTNLFSLAKGRHTVQENYTYSKELQSVFLDMNNVVDDISKVTIEDTDDYTYDSETGIVTLLNSYAEVVYSYNVGWITFPDETMEVTVTGILSDADYTEVNKAIASIPADLIVYTDETVTALNKAVNAVVNGKNITEQNIVDNYATAINDAIANLEYKPADYTKVNEAIAGIPTDLTVYTDETVTALNEAVNVVVNGKNITEQNIVDNYATAINDAIENLEYKPADYAKVNEAIASIPADLTVYTEETVTVLNEAVNAVINDKNITEQAIVDSYVQAINDAVANLEYKPADYTKVNEAIANIPEDLSIYTEETVTALNEAVNAVVNDKNITEQDVVDNYAKTINDAVANLEYKPANYTKVNEAIASIPADLTIYTKETVNTLNEAVNAVVNDKNITEQDIVDNYAKAINDAIKNLEYKPSDYAKVNEAIANIPADLTVYTEETVTALNEAVNAVVNDKNITEQDIVDSYAQAINDAIANLEYKPADYAKVNEAIASIPEDLSIYTEETVNALNEAVSAVEYDKNIIEQDIVDEYAKQIENAIAGLVLEEIYDEPIIAIPETEEQTTEPTTNKDTSSKSPETGAPSLVMPLIASLFILVCLALVFGNKKYVKKETR